MRYLTAYIPEATPEKENWGVTGEPVIPWFPAPPLNVFLGLDSFKKVPYAQVTNVPELDIDLLAKKLKDQFPGLPDTLCDNYIFTVAVTVSTLPVGTRFQVFVTEDSAKLRNIQSEQLYTLWETQPFKKES